MTSRIGLWSVQTSGKTTMLAALQTAIDHRQTDGDNWIIYGADRDSSDFLGEQIHTLAHRRFPVATPNQARPLTFSLQKSRHESWAVRAVRRSARGHRFDLTVLDVPGQYYGTDPRLAALPEDGQPQPERHADLFGDRGEELDLFGDRPDEVGSRLFTGSLGLASGDHVDQLVDHLARADGIVLLFDPVRELDQDGEGRDAYLYLRSMLERISGRAAQLGRMRDGKLPHFLAICITKLDDPIVFDRALKGGFLDVADDPAATPTVTGDDARDFFEELCTGREGGDGPVLGAIEGHFHPRRTRYFATSSIGFHVGPGGVFRIQDYRNVTEAGDRIRGPIRPINVIEPFLWLEKSVRKRRPPRPVAPQPPTPGPEGGPPLAGPGDADDDLTDVGGFPQDGAADGDFEDGYLEQPPAGRPADQRAGRQAEQPAAGAPGGAAEWAEPDDLP